MNSNELVDDRRCFACGPHNADGLHLEFAPLGADGAISRVTLPPRMQGWRDVAHGGIVMMLLDEAMAHACRFIGYRAVTAASNVRFRKPVPLNVPLVMRGHVKERRRNVIYLEATLELEDGTVLATGDGTFVSGKIVKSKVLRKAAAAGEAKTAAKEPSFDNRRARYEYEKLESLEVGIALSGTEIKSIRNGNLSLNEGFARLRDGELWLVNFTIPPYKEGSIFNHEPGRPRKLLLHKEQLERLTGRAAEKGLTLIPLRLYFKRGKVKLELGLMRGKKLWDKRRTIAERDAKRDLERVTS